jgi:cytochrome c oxidase assembly protein subunit 15
VPIAHPETQAITQWIEFGNRLLTVAVVVVAAACLVAALATRPRRPRLTRLALVQPLGVVAQAVIGGMTVLLQLVWWSVAVHFVVSMVMVWLAVQLAAAATAGDGPPRPAVPGAVRGLVATSAAVHADLLFAYLGMLVALGFTLRAVGAPRALLRRYGLLVATVVAQAALGLTQYALGVPEALVSLHVLGAALVTVGAAALWAGTVERPRDALVPPAPAELAPTGA